MPKRLNIGVDVDGVLADFTGTARKLCQNLFDGKPADDAIQTGWGFDSLGMTKEEENLMWRVIDATPNWWMTLNTLDVSHNFLRELVETHRVIFITNRKDGVVGKPIEQQTKEWLCSKFQLDDPNVIISDSKGHVARGLKLNYFIDDRDKNCNDVLRDYPDCLTYMCRWPWRPTFQDGFPNTVDDFNEFAERILYPIKAIVTNDSWTRPLKNIDSVSGITSWSR